MLHDLSLDSAIHLVMAHKDAFFLSFFFGCILGFSPCLVMCNPFLLVVCSRFLLDAHSRCLFSVPVRVLTKLPHLELQASSFNLTLPFISRVKPSLTLIIPCLMFRYTQT